MKKTIQMDNWQLVNTAMEHLRIVCLCGKPGIGKTFAGLNQTNNPTVVSVNLSEDTVVQELFGHYVPKGGEFVYADGPVVSAMRHGHTLVINELSRASAAVKDALLGALDSKESAKLTCSDGNTVSAHPNFRAIITSNESADELDPALRDRCETVINLTEPHPDLIKALNSALSGLGDAVMASYADPDRAISTRASFAFAKLLSASVPSEVSAKLAYADRATDILDTLKMRGVCQ